MAGSRERGGGRRKTGKRKWNPSEYKSHNFRNHSCPDDKVIYETRRDAKKAARKLQNNGRDLLSPYTCEWCGCIHLGHARRRGF